LWTWCRDDPEFAVAYENAKKIRAARLVEAVLSDIAKIGPEDESKARVMDAKARHRFKAASLFDPARYSESMHGALQRLPTGNAVQININLGGQTQETVTIEGKTNAK
jgi:hypothetical protein